MIKKLPQVMGILNVTPDSFYDGGFNNTPVLIRKRIKTLLKEGTDIIDVGGESTRPDAKHISAKLELKRIIPAIKEIRLASKKVLISVDTSKPEVAKKALQAGADIINDVTGFKKSAMLKLAVKYDCPIVIMHMRGTPKTMRKLTRYNDILSEIYDFFDSKIKQCITAGVKRRNIIIDPGIGFAKTAKQSLFLIKNLKFFRKLKVKVLLGASRKSFIGSALNQPNPAKRLAGSLAAAVLGYANGADILRVHDVEQTYHAIKIAHAVKTVKL